MAISATDFGSRAWILATLFLSFGLVQLTTAQPGFISIDCGGTRNYTDPSTTLQWTTDDGYISTGINRPVGAPSAADNGLQLTTARYFTEKRNKNCYALPVATNKTYLLRASFLYGDLEAAVPSNYRFDLSIDSTVVASIRIVQIGANDATIQEFIVASTSSQISFCVIPFVGKAFISSLELRLLEPTMYNGVVYGSKFLRLNTRLNCGASATDGTVRYPDDSFDRLWPVPGPNYAIDSIRATSNYAYDPPFDKPPMKVLQTAWTDSTFWFNTLLRNENSTVFYVALFFLDIGPRLSSDLRAINISLNGEYFYSYNVTTSISEVYSFGQKIISGSANFSLASSSLSTLQPILNGAEIHAIYDFVTTRTDASDVVAIDGLRQSLNLLDWTGDPCLPYAYDWLNCSNAEPPRVTQVKLSSYRLSGTIPAAIALLSQLTDLWLDNNDITGSIPNLSTLTNLRTLHLQNNSLTGTINEDLAYLPFLTELFLQDNHLTGPIPAALLNKTGLNLTFDNLSTTFKKKSSSGAIIGAAIGVVVVIVIVIGLIVFFVCCRKKANTHPQATNVARNFNIGVNHASPVSDKSAPPGAGIHHVQTARAFSHEEVKVATNNFARRIGEGGFGPVYYGKLANGLEVAVKVNSATSAQGENEFFNEVSLLSRVHHRNLVSLVGFCEGGGQQMLIYEFMQNGTLREHLYGKDITSVVDWRTRLDIAVNAARGLEYLHNDCNPKIIHRDVKSNNILLNEKLLAKVADFGISKLAPDEDCTTGVSTVVRGTTGYLDPEYYSTNKLTQKSDVFAFGVVLLEMITGRAPNGNRLPDAQQWNLAEYARSMMHEGNIQGLVDPALAGSYNVEAVWKMAELAMFCVEPRAVNRPYMRQVVRELTEAIDLELGHASTAIDINSYNLESMPSIESSLLDGVH